jgi:tetratricopeptide (TPR) repeat protein
MTIITIMLPLKRIAMQRAKFFPLLILTFFVTLSWLPVTGFAEQERPGVNEQKPEVTKVAELKQKAQDAYIHSRYAAAAALNLEIAEKYPVSKERRYSVQMLGTLYEDNLTDIKKAIKWDREFIKKYADPRQVPVYKEKVASLEKLMNQEQAFKTYQAIRFANKGDEVMVTKFEALLKDHPDFLLKTEVQRELAYAYGRLDKRRESYLAFQALSSPKGGTKLSSSDRIASEAAGRYWQMTSSWGWVAWGVVVMLWVAVLLMKPWEGLNRASIRKFLLLAVIWLLLIAASLPVFYGIDTKGDKIIFHDTAVFIAAGLNLTVLFWLLLLTKGKFWQTRLRALRWVSPLLTLLMTTAVFYLFLIHQPNGPEITDVFAVKYQQLMGELAERR